MKEIGRETSGCGCVYVTFRLHESLFDTKTVRVDSCNFHAWKEMPRQDRHMCLMFETPFPGFTPAEWAQMHERFAEAVWGWTPRDSQRDRDL